MFNLMAKDEESPLDKAINQVFSEMESLTADSDEYAKMVNRLEQLYKLKCPEKANKLSKDAILAVVGNLAGIVLILGYERAHVVASKALGFVLKSRV